MITVSKMCMCEKCESRTQNIYRMVGHCRNCGQGDILIIYRAGDKAGEADCPVCGNSRTVNPDRLATPAEIPEEGE